MLRACRVQRLTPTRLAARAAWPPRALLQVNSLVSAKSALPIEYYSLPFCRPAKIVSSAENLGEVLRGDRIYNSLYQVRVR